MKKDTQIIMVAFLLAAVMLVSLLAINYQADQIKILRDNNYQWCNLFIQQAEYTEFIIQSEWNESFKFEGYPNCNLLKR